MVKEQRRGRLMKISESSVKVWQWSRTKAEQGLGYAGPGAQRLGSTGTLGRRVRWADWHVGPTGRTGPGLPADGLRRPRGAGEIWIWFWTFYVYSNKKEERRTKEAFWSLKIVYPESVSLVSLKFECIFMNHESKLKKNSMIYYHKYNLQQSLSHIMNHQMDIII